ncbi:high mobility group protein dsp1 [Anaeramoeba flamelloides]|uniref:High mobility group protein dsp1 n=1 Tax=Anaeramoeba flamelloides TaxID=1746091 RepID=A0ABQ8YNE5_9EUKA|nr:high mobility group protein dsp1 [Anaeramoeba flamelloides]
MNREKIRSRTQLLKRLEKKQQEKSLEKNKRKKTKRRKEKHKKRRNRSKKKRKKTRSGFNHHIKRINSYGYYFQEKRPILLQKNPGLTFNETVQIVVDQWRNLSQEEKQPYIDRPIQEKLNYKKGIVEYENQFFSSSSDYSDLEYLSLSSDSDMSENEEKLYLKQIQEAHHEKINKNKVWIESEILRLNNEKNMKLSQKNQQLSTEKMDIPNLPQRPKAAYIWYTLEVRKTIEQEHPKWTRSQINKEISVCWNNLTEEDKSKYYKLSSEDQKRYQKEREANTQNIENNEIQIKKNETDTEKI